MASHCHEFTCKGCGNLFTRTGKMKKYNQFCKRECAFTYFRQHGGNAIMPFNQAKQAKIDARGVINTARRLSAWFRGIWEEKTITCKWCMANTKKHKPYQRFCSDECQRRSHVARRKCTERRRRKRMQDRPYDTYDGKQIFERDEYICHICNDITNRWAKVPQDDAPTIDHVVPIARGGTDTLSNVKCAHFRCNYLKNDKAGRMGSEHTICSA